MRYFAPANDRYGSWLCENSSARRARRNISKKLRIMESNDAARAMFDTLLENCIFYISPMLSFYNGVIPGSSHTPAQGISSPGIDKTHPGSCNHGEPQWSTMSD